MDSPPAKVIIVPGIACTPQLYRDKLLLSSLGMLMEERPIMDDGVVAGRGVRRGMGELVIF